MLPRFLNRLRSRPIVQGSCKQESSISSTASVGLGGTTILMPSTQTSKRLASCWVAGHGSAIAFSHLQSATIPKRMSSQRIDRQKLLSAEILQMVSVIIPLNFSRGLSMQSRKKPCGPSITSPWIFLWKCCEPTSSRTDIVKKRCIHDQIKRER